MSDVKQTEKYSNIKSVPIRTRLAVMLILIAVKILEPWEYTHQFSDDMKALQELLLGKEPKA